jgi:uncharacterized protein
MSVKGAQRGCLRDLDAGQMEKLVLACKSQTDGTISSDPTLGVCFDADRLDLGRVGIETHPAGVNGRRA